DPLERMPERHPDVAATDLEELVRGPAGDDPARDRCAAAGEVALVHPAREALGVDEIHPTTAYHARSRMCHTACCPRPAPEERSADARRRPPAISRWTWSGGRRRWSTFPVSRSRPSSGNRA